MKKDILMRLSEKNNGYLFTAEVLQNGISKTYLAKFVKENEYERVAYGIYSAPDIWPDELFILQKTNPRIIFSGETALYIHGLTDREYSKIEVTVPQGYNAVHLRKKNICVRSMRDKLYELGKSMAESIYGNPIIVYDKERTICNMIVDRKKRDIQLFQTAMKEYMSDSERKLPTLVRYAGGSGMIHTSKQLKDKVRNISHGDNQTAQMLIRNFIMERFLERVSISPYRNNFILKGGMLVASLVGIDTRATMDIDSTLKALPLNEEDAVRIVNEIIMMCMRL